MQGLQFRLQYTFTLQRCNLWAYDRCTLLQKHFVLFLFPSQNYTVCTFTFFPLIPLLWWRSQWSCCTCLWLLFPLSQPWPLLLLDIQLAKAQLLILESHLWYVCVLYLYDYVMLKILAHLKLCFELDTVFFIRWKRTGTKRCWTAATVRILPVTTLSQREPVNC